MQKAWDDNAKEARPQFKAGGINYAPASAKLVAEMRQRYSSFDADWIKIAEKKGIDGKAALAFYRKNDNVG